MPRTATIAEARDQLPALVHRAEAGGPIELTRRGKPVAVLLSMAAYERLRRASTADFLVALDAFRAGTDLAALDLAGALADVRDAGPGRDFSW